jgi:hypothetical protein
MVVLGATEVPEVTHITFDVEIPESLERWYSRVEIQETEPVHRSFVGLEFIHTPDESL